MFRRTADASRRADDGQATAHPLVLYGDGLSGRGTPTGDQRVRLAEGGCLALPLHRYLGPADETVRRMLSGLRGPVLDVGCGPGRHLHALAARGVFALGVDLSPVAVGLARDGGARAIVGSIFGEVPGAGSWRSALLLDGNIGIGGMPDRLLGRIAALLRDDSELLVELAPPATPTSRTRARIETDRAVSGWFGWATVSAADIREIASTAGFGTARLWESDGRWFALLVPSATRARPVRSD